MTRVRAAASSAGLAGAIGRGGVSEGGTAPLRPNYIGDGLRDALDPRKVLAK